MTTATTSSTTATTGFDAILASQKTTQNKTDETADRFLKLLVTQMQNQDPLNPMDNAQVTSQMAQINTVTGIDKLNNTVKDIGGNFAQMQMLQGAALVGHQVLVEGNTLTVSENGKGAAAYDLDASASKVTIEVLSSAGTVLDTVEQGAKSAGRQEFIWNPPSEVKLDQALSYRIKATSGSSTIGSTPLMLDQVDAVSNTGGSLTLELRNSGTLAYSKIKAVG